jgi:hypothetical protein
VPAWQAVNPVWQILFASRKSAVNPYGFQMSRWLILFGVILIVIGLIWPLLAKSGLGRLPGDIVIERGNFRLYLPLATSLIISIFLSALLWLLNR